MNTREGLFNGWMKGVWNGGVKDMFNSVWFGFWTHHLKGEWMLSIALDFISDFISWLEERESLCGNVIEDKVNMILYKEMPTPTHFRSDVDSANININRSVLLIKLILIYWNKLNRDNTDNKIRHNLHINKHKLRTITKETTDHSRVTKTIIIIIQWSHLRLLLCKMSELEVTLETRAPHTRTNELIAAALNNWNLTHCAK